ncbi:uncharacterized protein MONOS_13309 [Monocercomonoides exilis]|uniref:uncharacterized protein n=1 Tax=Monocercomonoides exilis TaxID=2049356 RepID=UPI00355A8748|nr:hypothetical protein MONOS_13309 [Monocercomonoides exilis]|eukprot:MONOS_13309.1-p1 / transcript=MONOS_13309.1 / gene=MONOS_13309 / organism=Monocercomonoides_exilis_PA203 / gene_product=unspecified product / transcript_product=unspecified product / location=Mono_scaffold00806:27075-27359(+) / protein_length=95 / sequence_SO=supercontig / SO=protein_coding / is_pseudo=false
MRFIEATIEDVKQDKVYSLVREEAVPFLRRENGRSSSSSSSLSYGDVDECFEVFKLVSIISMSSDWVAALVLLVASSTEASSAFDNFCSSSDSF